MSNFKTKKSLGQNFLKNPEVIQKIVDLADLTPNSDVIEIGVGSANMTTYLAESANRVLGIEIDMSLIPTLEKKLNNYPNVYIVFGDILKIDLVKEISSHFQNTENMTVVANIPYYITSPIVHLLLESKIKFKKIVLMVQKEVAYRIVAKPNSSEYSALSIYVQEFCNPTLEFIVNKNNFFPAPKVDSAVIVLEPHQDLRPINQIQEEMNLVQLAFSNRRKQLKNNLSNLSKDPENQERISLILNNLFGNSKIRAQELSLEQFRLLFKSLKENHLL